MASDAGEKLEFSVGELQCIRRALELGYVLALSNDGLQLARFGIDIGEVP